MDREMHNNSLAIVVGALILLAFPVACRAQQAAPGKWINRTLADTAANEASQRAKEIPPGRWWHLPYFANRLNITDQEKAQLDQLFDYNRNKLEQLKMQVEDQRDKLLDAINRQHLNETAAIAMMKTLESSRTLLASTRFTYSLEVRKLLGYERFERLKTLFRNWHGLQEYFSNAGTKNPGVRQAGGPQPSVGAQPAGNPGPPGGRETPRE
jgi:Spy/CpxP family protein refolding chaperone